MSVDTPEDLALAEQWLTNQEPLIQVSQLTGWRRAVWHGLCRVLGRKFTVRKYKSTEPTFHYWVWRRRISTGRLL